MYWIGFKPTGGLPQDWFLHDDGSWACVTEEQDGGRMIAQRGPQLLWDRVEELHREWIRLGKPARERFGVTVTPDRQWIWIHPSTSSITWELY